MSCPAPIVEAPATAGHASACGPILWATMAVGDLDSSVAAHAAGLGYAVRTQGRIGADLAGLWGAPEVAGARWALIGPPGHGPGALRLIETGAEAAAPLASLGWAAAELSVADADARLTTATDAGFRLLGPARQLGSNPAIRAGQLADRWGGALYLTDVRGHDGRLDLHRAEHDVDRCFIAVLASADLEADRSWFEAAGIGRRISDRRLAVPVLQRCLGLAEDAETRISSLQLGGGCLIEIDAYPADTPPRRTARGLPAGVALISLAAPAVATGWTAIPAPPYHGARIRVDRLPGGALLERVAAEGGA